MPDANEAHFPLADLPTPERAHNAVIGALVDVVLTLPDLPPDVVARLRPLRGPGLGFGEVVRIAREVSMVCRDHQAELGRT